MDNELKIDEYLHSLIPPLSPEEYADLEASILKHGCLDPIKVWKNTIIDGHNRYEICRRHDKPFEKKALEFESSRDAQMWIIRNQCARRNISIYWRGVLVMKLASIVKGQASMRKRAGKKVSSNNKVDPKETLPYGQSRDILAAQAGISGRTMDKIETIYEKGTPEQQERAATGKESVNKIHKEIVPPKPKKKDEYLPAITAAFKDVTLEQIQERKAGGRCPCCGGLLTVVL